MRKFLRKLLGIDWFISDERNLDQMFSMTEDFCKKKTDSLSKRIRSLEKKLNLVFDEEDKHTRHYEKKEY